MGKKHKKSRDPQSTVPAATAGDGHSDRAHIDDARPVLQAMRTRRSFSKVTDEAPSREELEQLIQALASVPDHSNMKPWRLIELRGDSRDILGRALAEADFEGRDVKSSPEKAEKFAKAEQRAITKARRAPLLIAVVACTKPSTKVPEWEQECVASGVAHALSLLLHEAGWGTIWRTGTLTRSDPVRRAHGLRTGELLLGWIYVGGIPETDRKQKPRKALDLERHLSTL